MQRAAQQIAESFDDLRRASDDLNTKQAALAQAQADLAKMRLETLASKAQIEIIQKTLSDFSAKTAASQFDSREMQKLIDELSEQVRRLRAR
jgi:peptidoglycan hydrolase CwlO-like protein